ncbi:MAG: diaminopimelate epimerase [Phycisphaerae bacterium]|nr:diaminopimelate epimerase [Phycisphaerae bacterium]
MNFTKMHGIGNDYVYVDCFDQDVLDPAALSRAMSDRHRGVGADGLILILPPTDADRADLRMRMYNADGSEAEMCGNGIRCLAKYAHDHGRTSARPMRVETRAGVLDIDYRTNGDGRLVEATVDMGPPVLDPARIPLDTTKLTPGPESGTFALVIADEPLTLTAVSMGNPHVIVFVEDLADQHLRLGPIIETHPAFPQRTNVHFAQVRGPAEITVRHWERGSGATLACGTGACAVCVAAALTGRASREVLAHLPGGDLKLRWDEQNDHVYMTGPATEVFRGVWPLPGQGSDSDQP